MRSLPETTSKMPDSCCALHDQLAELSEPIPDGVKPFVAPAAYCLREWSDYWIKLPATDRLRIGSRFIDPNPAEPELFLVSFANALGITEVQPYSDGQPLCAPVAVEVVSPKFPHLEEHVSFLTHLLSDLYARVTRLPFSLAADTTRHVAESSSPATPFFVYHFLLQHGFSLLDALQAVLAQPHRELVTRDEIVPLHDVEVVDADVLTDILHNPQRWVQAESGLIAQALQGHAPSRVRQSLPDETVDTPENRFVCSFVRRLLQIAEQLPRLVWWRHVPLHHDNKIQAVIGGLAEAILYAQI